MHVVMDERGALRAAFFSEHDDEIRHYLSSRCDAGYVFESARNTHGATLALARYFEGELDAIDALPVEAAGTHFQQEVWRALRTIPCGSTTSYGTLARQIGHPEAVRAVGAANGANPIAVVVPCHRVIGAKGSLTGYGGGIERKRWLLRHESAYQAGCLF